MTTFTSEDLELAASTVDDACRQLRLVLEDGPEQLELMEPLSPQIRQSMVVVTMAYLIEHDEGDELPITEDWIKGLPNAQWSKQHKRCIFQNNAAKVIFHKQDDGWSACVFPITFLKVKCRRDVTALLAGLQLQ